MTGAQLTEQAAPQRASSTIHAPPKGKPRVETQPVHARGEEKHGSPAQPIHRKTDPSRHNWRKESYDTSQEHGTITCYDWRDTDELNKRWRQAREGKVKEEKWTDQSNWKWRKLENAENGQTGATGEWSKRENHE